MYTPNLGDTVEVCWALFLNTPEGFIVVPEEFVACWLASFKGASSRVKLFLHESKCTILTPHCLLGLGITRYLAIWYYHDILPKITIISRYSDSVIIDILQEISSTIHHDICVTEEILNLLTALNPFHRNYKSLSINFTWMTDKQNKVFSAQWLFLTHTLTATEILLNIDIWRNCINNKPQDKILRYIVVSIFWYTPNIHIYT